MTKLLAPLALAIAAALAVTACNGALPLPGEPADAAAPGDATAPGDAAPQDALQGALPDGAAAVDLARGPDSDGPLCTPSSLCSGGTECGGTPERRLCCDVGAWCDSSVDPPVCRCGVTPFPPMQGPTGCICEGTPPNGGCGTGPNFGCP
jgi:hypothetical protein